MHHSWCYSILERLIISVKSRRFHLRAVEDCGSHLAMFMCVSQFMNEGRDKDNIDGKAKLMLVRLKELKQIVKHYTPTSTKQTG